MTPKPLLASTLIATNFRNGADYKANMGAYIPSRAKSGLAKAPNIRTHALQVVVHSETIFTVTLELRALRELTPNSKGNET